MSDKTNKKYVLYAHDGSGNHGCEALVRSTAKLLNTRKNDLVLLSARPDEDNRYGLGEICEIVNKTAERPLNRASLDFLRAYYYVRVKKDFDPIDYHRSAVADKVKKGDVALSIGGDTYCYKGTNELIRTHKKFKFAGLKTVFWGCSVEPKILEKPEIAEDIKSFDLITARETISYEALKKVNPNTVLVCDSAFLLNKKDIDFPDNFGDRDIVGINASPLIEECENGKGVVRENYENLIEYILNNTDMKIALIPHVVWEAVDDRKILSDFYNKYKGSGRVLLLEDCGCEELKGYISKCRYFIGARTHATIAAYSTCVPTLVVGYSVKARGIAQDLFGTWENYVLPAQELKDKNELSNAFKWLCDNENNIKNKLEKTIPEYKNRVYNGVKALEKL